jgi:hypothetical protein
MEPTTDEMRVAPLRVHPNLSTSARMIGVDVSTISRRKDLQAESRGERDKVLRPTEVMRLATIYRQRSLNDVAQDLIEHARAADADGARAVEIELESFFERRAAPKRREDFLGMARQLLPAQLYEEVESAVETRAGDPPGELDGAFPLPPGSED